METKHIALLVDVDNVDVSFDNFNEIIAKMKERGNLDYIKLYGFNERKHTSWDELLTYNGIETCSRMRFRKRNKSQIDQRLVVDAMTICYTKPSINEMCIIAGKGDMVPLLTRLRLEGVSVVDVMNFDFGMNGHMFNERLLLQTEIDPQKIRKNKLSSKLAQYSEKAAALAMEDNVDSKARDALIADIEKSISELEVEGQGSLSEDEEERELFDGLKNVLEILKTL